MGAPKTLHEFVLTLLSDPDARTAFQLDPEGALHAAGLSDINALDVREAIPLVTDYVPVQSMSTLDAAGTGDLNGGDAGGVLRGDRGGAIHELAAVVRQVPLAGQVTGDLSLAATGTLAGDPTAALSAGAGLAGAFTGPLGALDLSGSAAANGGFAAQHDLAHTIDGTIDGSTVDGSMTGGAVVDGGTVDGSMAGTGAVGAGTGTLDGSAAGSGMLGGGALDPNHLLSTVDTGHLVGALSGVTAGLGQPLDLTHGDGVTGTVHGLTGTLSQTLGGDPLGTATHATTDPSLGHSDGGGLLGHLSPLTAPVTGTATDTAGHVLDLNHLF